MYILHCSIVTAPFLVRIIYIFSCRNQLHYNVDESGYRRKSRKRGDVESTLQRKKQEHSRRIYVLTDTVYKVRNISS